MRVRVGREREGDIPNPASKKCEPAPLVTCLEVKKIPVDTSVDRKSSSDIYEGRSGFDMHKKVTK